jgi:hypothetical protein
MLQHERWGHGSVWCDLLRCVDGARLMLLNCYCSSNIVGGGGGGSPADDSSDVIKRDYHVPHIPLNAQGTGGGGEVAKTIVCLV